MTRHRFRRRGKFNAKPTERDGMRFDSRKEAERYDDLKQLQSAGEVVFFLRQVPFHLPGKTKCIVDFQVFWSDGAVTFEDVKGVETETFRLKKRQVEALYPIEIEVRK